MAMDISGLNKAILNTQKKLGENVDKTDNILSRLDAIEKLLKGITNDTSTDVSIPNLALRVNALDEKKPDIGIARVNIEDISSISENYPVGTLIAINDPVNNTDSILGGLHLYCGENNETNELMFSKLANEQDIQHLNHYIHQINSYTDKTSIYIGGKSYDINWKILQYSDNTVICYGQFSFLDDVSYTWVSSTYSNLPVLFTNIPHINVELINGGIRNPSDSSDCSNTYGEVNVTNITESKFGIFVYDPKRLTNRTVQIELYGEQVQAD